MSNPDMPDIWTSLDNNLVVAEPPPIHPLSTQRPHLPTDALLMNVDEAQIHTLPERYKETGLIAYAPNRSREQATSSILLYHVLHAIRRLEPASNPTIVYLHRSQDGIRNSNYPAVFALVTDLRPDERVRLIVHTLAIPHRTWEWPIIFASPIAHQEVIVQSPVLVWDPMMSSITQPRAICQALFRHVVDLQAEGTARNETETQQIVVSANTFRGAPYEGEPKVNAVTVTYVAPPFRDQESRRDLMQSLRAEGFQAPGGGDDLDEAILFLFCTKCWAINHPRDKCWTRIFLEWYTTK